MVLWGGFPLPRDANILLRARKWIDLFSITVPTHVLLTSYVKFGHPCGLYCKVSHRQGRPAFNRKPGIVEPSARQLRARSSTCLQSWSNRDTFRTFGFACPANRSSGLSCAHRATQADLETGFISEAWRQMFEFPSRRDHGPYVSKVSSPSRPKRRPVTQAVGLLSVISVGHLCRR